MKTTEKKFYHGTWSGHGYSLMTRGFELGHEGRGNELGRGVYLAQKLETPARWWYLGLIIKCRLQSGTRILWFDDTYDRKVIAYLRREFGQELLDLGTHFHRAIPHNKHLTQKELIHLCSYTLMRLFRKRNRRFGRATKGKMFYYQELWMQLARLHGEIKRHGYDAIGNRSFAYWDSDEILVYNPARVIPVSAHRLCQKGEDGNEKYWLSEPIPLEKLQIISKRAQEEDEQERISQSNFLLKDAPNENDLYS